MRHSYYLRRFTTLENLKKCLAVTEFLQMKIN